MSCGVSILLSHLDHLVLTVRDIPTTVDFYTHVLGMEPLSFAEGRQALRFGNQKINLHSAGREFEPKASQPAPGSADLCFITRVPMADIVAHLQRCGVVVIEGPVQRTGARSPLLSIYFRDPDGNLLEVANETSPPESSHSVG